MPATTTRAAPLINPLVAAISLAAAAVEAAPLDIVNAGFESPYFVPGGGSNNNVTPDGSVLPGAFPVGDPPTGWTLYVPGAMPAAAYVGILNPTAGTFFPAGAPEGSNVLLLYVDDPAGGPAYGVEQVLTSALAPLTRYTLTVEVGNIASGSGVNPPVTSFFGIEGFPGYQVQLLAGGSLLAQDDSTLAPGEGEWATSTIVFESGASHAELGQALRIRLLNLNRPATMTVPAQNGVEVDFDHVRLDATAVPVPALGVACAALAGVLLRTPRRRC